jgi:hypothetical protein
MADPFKSTYMTFYDLRQEQKNREGIKHNTHEQVQFLLMHRCSWIAEVVIK